MLLQAEHIQPVVDERVLIKCPPAVTDLYKKIGQLSALLVIGPIALLLFTCILHVPILPVIGMVFLLWLVRKLEDPLTRVTVMALWPPHRLWLQWRDPNRLQSQKVRTIRLLRRPTQLDLNGDSGELRIGRHTWSLPRHHSIGVERAYEPEPQLRLRLFQKDADPIVVGAILPFAAQDKLQGPFELLPRKEGEVVMLPWDDFVRFVQTLGPIHEAATGHKMPKILGKLSVEA